MAETRKARANSGRSGTRASLFPSVPANRQPSVKRCRATLPPMLAPSVEVSRPYDLCINVAGRRLSWRNPNHGVTLGHDTIAWTMDGDAMQTAYGNIVAVHLNSAGQKITADRCTISFADGSGLLIVNTDPGGYRDAERALSALNPHFVRDSARAARLRPVRRNPLHRRRAALALSGDAWISAIVFAAPVFRRLPGWGGHPFYNLRNGLFLLRSPA